jgi:hypothetical protein
MIYIYHNILNIIIISIIQINKYLLPYVIHLYLLYMPLIFYSFYMYKIINNFLIFQSILIIFCLLIFINIH